MFFAPAEARGATAHLTGVKLIKYLFPGCLVSIRSLWMK